MVGGCVEVDESTDGDRIRNPGPDLVEGSTGDDWWDRLVPETIKGSRIGTNTDIVDRVAS